MGISVHDRSPYAGRQIATLVQLLRERGGGVCANRGYTYFRGDELEDEWLRYSELHSAAKQIAAKTADLGAVLSRTGRDTWPPRAIVLCPPGPSYIKALFGTLYAGLVAVTAYPPRPKRRDARLDRVVQDSGAEVALVDSTVFERREQIAKSSPAMRQLTWVNVDDLSSYSPDDWTEADPDPDTLAILQYTSGSTSDPKGVCLSHRNVLANLRMIYEVFEVATHKDSWCVTWLPPYHDMGLIGGLLQVMYAGECSHVISPASFVQKPIRWLKAIEKYKASVSGGPNFAYDACVDRIPQAERESIDLGSWTLAFTGAEPVRQRSLDRFAEAFRANGFQRRSFFPCYGLAEATLIVSGGPRDREPQVSGTSDPIRGTVSELPSIVGCGRVAPDQQVRIVDPSTGERLPDQNIGEIWVAGENVSSGYWGRTDTSETFDCRLPGHTENFLRTGDLGFIEQGELFVAGRLKELVVIRGRNFHPSDIEAEVAGCDPRLIPNALAAFEVESDEGGGLVLVAEVERCSEETLQEVLQRIRVRIIEALDIEPRSVVLIPRRKLPVTTSGKVKRLETKRLFSDGAIQEFELASLRPSAHSNGAASESKSGNGAAHNGDASSDEIAAWLVNRLAKQLNVDPVSIDVTRPFVQYGLDSVSAVQITSELENYVGREIAPTLFYEAPTIKVAAAKLGAAPRIEGPKESRTVDGEADASRARAVAIAGAACRLPGCQSVEEYWHLLSHGRTAVCDPPPQRRDCVSSKSTTQRGGWIDDPDLFDAGLFGISPREANFIDPQHRLLLETVWRAIEDAGVDPARLAGSRTGVFVGISNRDYERLLLENGVERSTYSMTGNAASMAAHRISYHLDLHGPSLAIDTACSSSLVAVHQAVRAIQSVDCDSAIVAGVNLILNPVVSETLSDAEMLSPDGLCKTFDASANGYVRGEGCVAMLLRPLAEAVAGGGRSRGVILGSAVNQDGMTNGITAPNGDSQERLYREALRDAKVEPSDVTLLEAHGTGTPLGDPIEVQSLRNVYGNSGERESRCALGAVKANIGHLEAAAGMAGLLKVVLQLQHRAAAPQPHLSSLNPHIDLTGCRLTIPASATPWRESRPRLAAVSSFGFGGTNAHVILGESVAVNLDVPERANTSDTSGDSSAALITLSAKTDKALRETAAHHARVVDDCTSLSAISAATQSQKTSHPHRLAVIASTGDAVANRLRQFALGETTAKVLAGVARTDRSPAIAFAFSGQGSQHVGMGRGLYRRSPIFRKCVDECNELLKDEFGYGVLDLFTSEPGTNGSVAKLLEGPESQSALFILQHALAKTLNRWGVRSSCVIGHSMGEYAAAVTAGVMDWQDGLRLTARRANAVAGISQRGSMTAVFAPLDVVRQHLQRFDAVSIAAIDAPAHVIVSGPDQSVRQLESNLQRVGIETRHLRVSHGFHSELVEPALETIEHSVADFTLRAPTQTYISSLSGYTVSGELVSSEYWTQHSRQPVQFVKALDTLAAQACDLVVEVGPHETLCRLSQLNETSLDFRPALVRGDDGWESIKRLLGELFVRGAEIEWDLVASGKSIDRSIRLPGHPFHRKRYWIQQRQSTTGSVQPMEPQTATAVICDQLALSGENTVGESSPVPPLSIPAADDELQRYSSSMAKVDRRVAALMHDALQQVVGGPLEPGQTIDPDSLIARNAVVSLHRSLLLRICKILEEERILRRAADDTDIWVVETDHLQRRNDLEASSQPLDEQVVRHELKLLSRCGMALPDVLRGRVDPLSVLFPEADSSDLEALYRASPIARRSNQLVANAAAAMLERVANLDPIRRGQLRVLEIGAGTGGTTSSVFPQIRQQIATYVFSDVSPVLLAKSAARLGGDHCLQYQPFDIQKEPGPQGLASQSFDLVIAANVIHATPDVRRSLTNAQSLIRPGGYLLLVEGIRRERFLDLVFGLTKGWWHFTDSDLRNGYPLLPEARWIEVLGQCGFGAPIALPYQTSHRLVGECQSVLAASVDARDVGLNSSRLDPPVDKSNGVASAQPANSRSGVVTDSHDLELIEAVRASSGKQRRAAIESYLRAVIAKVLEYDAEELDIHQPVSNLGIDSLMALQLKNRLESELQLTIPMVAFLDGKSIDQLIELALRSDAAHAQNDEHTPETLTSESVDATEIDPVAGPMSEGQLALWMIHQRAPESPAYNFAFAAKSRSRINLRSLQQACRQLLERHPVLRTAYRMESGDPVRVVQTSCDPEIVEVSSETWSEEELVAAIRRQADLPFDLRSGPVIRFSLLHGRDNDVLSIAVHHIAADLWSMDLLIRELRDLYSRACLGNDALLPTEQATYGDFVHWEQELIQGGEGDRLWSFWREKLQDAPHTLNLPTTYPRPPQQTFRGDSHNWSVPTATVNDLRELAKSQRTTFFTVMLSAYQIFLSRICGQDDLLVGTVAASRDRAQWENIVGYFLNHLVVRSHLADDPSFLDALGDTRHEMLSALDHQAFPFAKLVERIAPARDPSRSPLVQTMFIWDKPGHMDSEPYDASGRKTDTELNLEPLLIEQRGAPFDLTLVVFELGDSIELSFRYNTDLFDSATIDSFAQSFGTLLDSIARDPKQKVRSVSMLSEDQSRAITSWNSTDKDLDPKLSGYALFNRHVELTPDAIAIESEQCCYTYAQAARLAEGVARHLREKSVAPGDIVGLCVPRGAPAIIGILGVWKLGAAYLPLDIDQPQARLQGFCDDASPAALIVSSATDDGLKLTIEGPSIDLDRCLGHVLSDGQTDETVTPTDPDLPAYVIYTSGSTGRPKGVVITQRGVANLALAQAETFGIVGDDRCLQFASLGFDASVFEMIMAFHAGATLVVLDSTTIRSTASGIADAIGSMRVSVATLPPSVLRTIPDCQLPDLRTLISAGEACSASLVKRWGTNRRMFNAYGPTEVTVWASTQLCDADRDDDPALGRPITNTRLYVVDEALQPVPIGVPGELCVAGPGVAVGYHNMPRATAEAFVPNPFDDRFDAVLYRTGDRARWTSAGELEFLGRVDDQIKLDGHRIEPSEIAVAIRQLDGIDDAIVVTADRTNHQLLSYVIPGQDADVNGANIRRQLADQLPCYMIPSQVVPVSHFPLTTNGKVDLRSLPRPDIDTEERTVTPPTTPTESALVAIWREVLEIEQIGVHDNFFELGGASLQALQAADLASRQGYRISADRLFQFQTIAELAREADTFDEADDSGEPSRQRDSTDAVAVVRVSQSQSRERSGAESVAESPPSRLKMAVESLGMYLPPDVVTTSEVIAGCRKPLEFPLAKMTGIKSRRIAGETEFSIDLARHAAVQCLANSRFDASDIDLLIASNISRYDGPDFTISYEPSTASKLKHALGARSAVAFDVCNACAGVFTALKIAESQLLSGRCRRAMIVSGEYITHLMDTAQKEIDGFLDPRLACLTLGDAGVALIVELTDTGFGFETLDLYTAGRHHELCVARATDQPHGGAIMSTDSIKASAVTLEHAVKHAHRVATAHRWSPDDVDHVIMHQTSATTIDGAIEELNRHFGKEVCTTQNTVNNLCNRGNTATTTHWVAVMDLINQGRIKNLDKAIFAISGSGQTVGTALYQFDDLPERVGTHKPVPADRYPTIQVERPHVGVKIVAASAEPVTCCDATEAPKYSDYQVVESAAHAAADCLRRCGWEPNDVDLLIHTGVYRDDFLSEPAVAAILAGALNMNDDFPHTPGRQTLAFDLADSARGTLIACDVAAAMIRSGQVRRALVTASEIENNSDPQMHRGVATIGSAIALERCDDPAHGLSDVFCRSYAEHAGKLNSTTAFLNQTPTLVVQQTDDYSSTLVRCAADCIKQFVSERHSEIEDYDRILVSLPPSIEANTTAQLLNVDPEKVVVAHATEENTAKDAFTSGLAQMWESLAERCHRQDNETWLLAVAGAGIEVACAEYRHGVLDLKPPTTS